MSFTATNSMAGSPSEARKMLRPMRPNPLIPTLIGILPPRCGGDSSAQQDRKKREPEAKQTMLGRVSGKVKTREAGERQAFFVNFFRGFFSHERVMWLTTPHTIPAQLSQF